MRDQYDARLWNDSHEEFCKGTDHFFQRLMQAFRVLHRIAWSAPWAEEGGCKRPCQS